MKKLLSAALALTLCLTLASCRRDDLGNNAPQEPDPPQEPVPQDTYALREISGGEQERDSGDGTLLSEYSYRLYEMEVPEDASQEARDKAEVFNARMEELRLSLEQSGRTLAESARSAEAEGLLDTNYAEETTASVSTVGDLISLKMDGYGYTGGVHANTWAVSYLFDWAQGAYIDPIEVADDPELFRATVTDQLLDQIMGLDEEIRAGYFTGYEETVSRWNEYCVTFQPDCLEVTFSTYELGPYAMGTQVFTLDYVNLTEALGELGAARLGLSDGA